MKRGKPLTRQSPLRAKRAGRVRSPLEKLHLQRVAAMRCLACGRQPVTVHHVTGYADRAGRVPRSEQRIVPLCAEHHLIQWGPRGSVEALGHQGFHREYGIDLLGEAERLWEETCAAG